jgi:cytochrome c-type biogenesis protein CcmH
MTEFTVLALLLSLGAMVFVLLPVVGSRQRVGHRRQQANVAAYQARLAELQADGQSGEYSEQELQRLTLELQRRLLEETEAGNAVAGRTGSRWSYLLFALLVPIAALALYQQIGADKDWQIASTIQQGRQQIQAGQDAAVYQHQLVQQLRKRLASDQSNQDYWILLGRTEIDLGEYAAAANSFGQLVQLVPQDAVARAHHAQALYLSSDRQLTTEVKAAADKALELDPQQPTVLGLLGIHYYHQGQWQQAKDYWQRLLTVLEPGSANAQMITGALEELQSKLGTGDRSLASLPVVKVNVALATELQADADAPVFIYARAIGGSKMPLAIARLTVADLPANVLLNDTMAMSSAMKLSSYKEVELIARIAKSGIANAASGDLEGSIDVAKVEKDPAVVYLLIDRVLP